MSIIKVEREQMKKNNQSLSNELRTLQEKLTRQSGALSTGLSDLKSHLDHKDLEKHQSVNVFLSFNSNTVHCHMNFRFLRGFFNSKNITRTEGSLYQESRDMYGSRSMAKPL